MSLFKAPEIQAPPPPPPPPEVLKQEGAAPAVPRPRKTGVSTLRVPLRAPGTGLSIPS